MKFSPDRPYSDPEKAARKIMEIANAVQAVQAGRIPIEKINAPFLFRERATPAEYGASLKLAIERGTGAKPRLGPSSPVFSRMGGITLRRLPQPVSYGFSSVGRISVGWVASCSRNWQDGERAHALGAVDEHTLDIPVADGPVWKLA